MNNKNSVKKIIFTGSESTGKSTLSRRLADHLKEPCVPEFARTYLSNLTRPYNEEDLLEIAKGQLFLEQSLIENSDNFLICDTSMLVVKVWSEFKYGRCHSFILEKLASQKNDFFILCGIDVPWEADVLRENPNPDERLELYNIYKKELRKYGFSFLEIQGSPEERFQQIFESGFGKNYLNSLYSP